MGQSSSYSRERRRSLRPLKLSTIYPKTKKSLSATFVVFDRETCNDLININTASEEQLMTLPSITRDIAHNIIEHRQIIGRFKRVDDLALVSGIGAEKLHKLRSEIYVREIVPNGDVSNSLTSLSSDHTQELNYIDLNSASIFELQTIVGVSQELAANIIYYRDKKGPFSSMDDLKKVKGIDTILFSVLKSYLVVNYDSNSVSTNNNTINNDGYCELSLSDKYHVLNHTDNCIQNKKQQFTNYSINSAAPSAPLNDIFDLLSAYSHRPVVDKFNYMRDNKKALRIATWNLQALSFDKAQNPGFLEVCCRTILENRFSIIAIQDIIHCSALETICNELNNSKLRRVIEWQQKHHKTKYNFKFIYRDQLGFIYISQNDCMRIDFLSYQELEICADDATVINARMCVDNVWFLNFVNIDVYNYSGNLLKSVINLLDSDDVVILGDFTGFIKFEDDTINYTSALPVNTETNSTKIGSNLTFLDNIFLSREVSHSSTGFKGIVTEGLSHLAIPQGWSWGGVASEHCPVWCELYIKTVTKHLNHVITQV